MAMHSATWRRSLHTFVDEDAQMYTVTNVPPIINISKVKDTDLRANLNLGSLLRPQLSIGKYPELPFVLLRPPVGDPLLSRLCTDPDSLVLAQFDGGWALPDDIRNTWTRLEKGLIHISELLLTSTERSSCGTTARYAIRNHDHWSPPEDYGYRKLHRSVHAARTSICGAHMAFRFLVARCSLAIALWLFPGPDLGRILPTSTTKYDKTDSTIPHWFTFLGGQGVHVSWLNAIRDSIITNFSMNLRVGTVVDLSNCEWLAMLPVVRAANLPVFLLWHDKAGVRKCIDNWPFMKSFTPQSDQDFLLARQHPPVGRPRIVTLCCQGQIRLLPNYSAFDDSTPPFGPYQLPRESRVAFFQRRACYRPDQRCQETQVQMQRRQEREKHVKSGLPPDRHSRIIWMVHPPDCKEYNPFYDEWDLWFPPGWGNIHEMASEDHCTELKKSIIESSTRQDPSNEAAKCASFEMVTTTVHDEQELLNPSPEDLQIQDAGIPATDYLHSWYGLLVDDTRMFPDVDYEAWKNRLFHLFSHVQDKFPDNEAIVTCIAGWTWAMLTSNFKSLQDPRISLLLEHHEPTAQNIDNISRWVLVRFMGDPETQTWSLLTSSMGVLFLVRHVNEAETSYDALCILSSAGIPARTGLFLRQPPSPVLGVPPPSMRHLQTPFHGPSFHGREDRPGLKEYDAYCHQVLELSQMPHMRCAWLKGGIVWRIMVEVTGRHPCSDRHRSWTIKDELVTGPSNSTDRYHPVTTDEEGGAYYDDGLSIQEMDVIVGIVKVLTGNGHQTEDVSWWPKHAMWVKGGWYTGIWSPWDEQWFRRRLEAIRAGSGPMNGVEWREELRKHKKARKLTAIVEQKSWDFMCKHLIQNAAPVPV
ncbi:hypothetical protein V8D89_012143 [Ganoderma adspersum]